MSFSILPLEIKIKIFGMLGIGSRYNASLVWKEMTHETLRLVPTEGRFNKRLKYLIRNDKIYDLDDLETAGVLASIGHLDSEDMIYVDEIDLRCSPINIVNCLLKSINGVLVFNRVTGLSVQMLENINCWKMNLFDLELSSSVPEEASAVAQYINVSEKVSLSNVSGDKKVLFDMLTCDSLQILETSPMDSRETMSLTEMFKIHFEIFLDDEKNDTLDYRQLANYDGKGRCEITILWYYEEDMKDYLESWADSVGWTAITEEDDFGGEHVLKLTRSDQTDFFENTLIFDPMMLQTFANMGINI